MIKWIKHPSIDGRIGVISPYNQLFVEELKRSVMSCKWKDGSGIEAWFFDEEFKEDALPVLEKFYGNPQWHRVEFALDRDDNVTVDGVDMFSVFRDYWNWRRSFPFKRKVVEEKVSSGGSRRYPHLSGHLIIEIECRPDAVFDPEPVSVTPVGERPKNNRLAVYPTGDLLAELARRGHVLLAEASEREMEQAETLAYLTELKRQFDDLYLGDVKKVLKSLLKDKAASI